MRGEQQKFTHSRVMSWVAMDRSIKDAERLGLDAPVGQWKRTREAICRDVLAHGYDAERGSFVQRYGAKALDASLLLIPIVGFLPASDPRVRGTIAAIRRELTIDGLVQRYRTEDTPDGLPVGEGVFLPCSFWMVDALWLSGQRKPARELYERLLQLRNDVGLLAEEYDPRQRRMLGNFPQALSHVALVNSARNLASRGGPGDHRSLAEAKPPPGAPARERPTHAAGVETVPVQPAQLDSRRDPSREQAQRERDRARRAAGKRRNQARRPRVANHRS
jgi:GH15 family glucan-1,4-alpha-glucosidase